MRRLPPLVRSTLDRLAGGEAQALDLALARLLAGLDAEHGTDDPARARTVALSAALLVQARRDGHSAVVLSDWAGRPFPGDADDPLPHLPDLGTWTDHLTASPVVGGPGEAYPLVVDGHRLALKRFWDAEGRVADAVRARLSPDPVAVTEAVRNVFAALFPHDTRIHGQALAAAAALRGRVLFVAGGPGTGKTYTATRLLALLLAARPGLRVALAAPTGKAAQRLAESLATGVAGLPEALRAGIPSEAVTLHRLLGASPHRSGFAHDARRPLPHDLVLVDEGSMVDLPLFDALFAALRPEARLVVLGDPDQLPPVEVGTTFAELCEAGAGPVSSALAAFCADLGLDGVPPSPEVCPMTDAVVTLTESRRFGAESGIGRLAAALRDGDAEATLAVLAQNEDARLVETDPAASALAWVLPHARAVVAADTPEAALDALGRFRLLAAVRRGPRGVEGLNAAIETALRREGRVRWSPYAEPFYPGRPLLVTANDAETGLANGDVGVAAYVGGERGVVFPDGRGGTRAVRLAQLPAHEPAWALTVHKSQGSEFDAVGVVLPEPGTLGASLLSRELLYTAVTRAKRSVVLFGERAGVSEAATRRTHRRSGLGVRLGAVAAAGR